MDELMKIKSLEAQLSHELENARGDAAASVQAAKAARKEAIDSAVRQAQSQAGRQLTEYTGKAVAEADKIKAACEGDMKVLDERHSRNFKKAVDYVLTELGV